MRKYIGLFLGYLLALGCRSTPVPATETINEAMVALDRGEYGAALRGLTTAIHSLREPEAMRQALFYRGLAEQNLAASAHGASQTTLYHSAAADYEGALQRDETAGGVLNNLARVYQALGDARAEGMFRRACALTNHPDRPLYLKNFADYQLSHGNIDEARRLEREAADLAGNDRDAQRQLLQLHLGNNRDTFAPYVQQLIDSGAIEPAEDAILVALRRSDLSEEQADSFFVLLARALIHDPYDPTVWNNTAIATRMRSTAEANPSVSKPIDEILLLHDRPVRAASEFSWWRNGGRAANRRIAFARLAFRLGSWYAQRHDLGTASDYFRVATGVTSPEETEPDIILGLAEILYAKKDTAGVQALAAKYDAPLRRRLSDPSGTEELFAFHRTLTLVLDELNVWKTDRQVDSATYQLTAMMEDAKRYGRRNDRILPVENSLVSEVVSAQIDAGDTHGALLVRTAAAETYLAQGETSSLIQLIQETPPTSLATADTRLAKRFLACADVVALSDRFTPASRQPTRVAALILHDFPHDRETGD